MGGEGARRAVTWREVSIEPGEVKLVYHRIIARESEGHVWAASIAELYG